MITKQQILYIKNLIIEVGRFADEHQNTNLSVELKPDGSPVTHADKIISSSITNALLKLTPHTPVISEEEELPKAFSDTFWLVDPIDGTRSYIKGEDTYTVNIGLIENGAPTYGFIYQPRQKLLHYTNAQKQLIVERNGVIVPMFQSTRGRGEWKAALSSRYEGKKMVNLLKLHDVIYTLNIPSSIKLCLVADGSVDLYPRFRETMEWDIAAGHALIKACGGDILDLEYKVIEYSKPALRNKGFIACGANFLRYLHAASAVPAICHNP